MHVFALASLPDSGETFTLQPTSFCAATPGEPLRGPTRTTERRADGRTDVIYAIGAVSHKASSRVLVLDIDTDQHRWTQAILAGWNRAFPGITSDENRQQLQDEIHDMLALAAEWPVGTEMHFAVPEADPGGHHPDGINVTFTEASDVTRIIAADLAPVTRHMINTLHP